MKVVRITPLFVLFGILLAGGSLVWSYEPAVQNEMLEIPLATRAPETARDTQASRNITDAIAAQYGGKWRVHSWNTMAGSPHYVHGSGSRLASQVTGAAQLEQLARQVIADNFTVFRAQQDELVLSATPHAKERWVAHFQQQYRGVDVWQGRVLVSVADDGRLLLLGSDFYADIELDVQPTLSPAGAKAIAQADLPFDFATDRVEEETELLILPVLGSETSVDYHLVYRVRVHTGDPYGIWVSHVDAHDGEIIWRYNDVHFDFAGTASADVQPNTYCDGRSWEPARYLRLDVAGNIVNVDVDGNWNAPGSGSAAITSTMTSPYVNVINQNGPDAYFSDTVYEGTPLDVIWEEGNSRQDERDVFDGINDIHEYFEMLAPEFAYPNAQIQAFVNRTDGYCPGNAWWNGTINFCAAGGNYANTGEIQGVVYHEFGHGVQDAILGWQGDEGLGEGNSDILAAIFTQDPIVGRGFYAGDCINGIRNADNYLIYPDDVIGHGVHYAGQVILGFHWRAMIALQGLYGLEGGRDTMADAWHYGRVLLQPTTQPDQVYATFFADDDDGYLDNGTPHYEIYAAAAEHHNFPYPELLGTVQGHVTNASAGDAPIPGALISVLDSDWTMLTGTDGSYEGEIRPGVWDLAVYHESCNQDTLFGVEIILNEVTSDVDFSLDDIVGPSFIGTTILGNTEDDVGPYIVETTVTDLTGVDERHMYYTSSAQGGPFEAPLTVVDPRTGLLRAEIPGQPVGTRVQYWLTAVDVIDNVSAAPANAPWDHYAFVVVEGLDILLFGDDMESDSGWTVGAADDDATGGIWERADPNGVWESIFEIQPEDDHTPEPGLYCWITGNDPPGSPQGTDDVDDGKTTLLSPWIDLAGHTGVTCTYFRWYTNNSGGAPNQDSWVVQVTGDGTNWFDLENTTGSYRIWFERSFLLSDYLDLDDAVRFQFIASDYEPSSIVEAGIDDFSVTGYADVVDQAPPTVTLLTPNGGEVLEDGQQYEITWNAADDVGIIHTEILLSRDGGVSWPDTLASGPFNGSWNWQVTADASASCRIRVVCYDAVVNATSDESDADFSIEADTGVAGGVLPVAMFLAQNQPNPFNPATEIAFGLPATQKISLKIFDVNGRLIRTLADGEYPAGRHSLAWRGTDDSGRPVASGMYFYRLTGREQTVTNKMLLLK